MALARKQPAGTGVLEARPRLPEAPFPGIPSAVDGAGVVVHVETQVSQGACAYPITPSSEMGEGYQAAVANGGTNLWGERLAFLEPESEHSSASACEGFALAGGRVANFTSGQGLVLMKEVLFAIAGKGLPVVFHVGARALTSHALNVHAGHDDVMAVADTGWGMLFAMNVQEAADLALIARRAAEEGHTPFFNVQDGFLTTHTLESVRLPEPELMKRFVGAPDEKLRPVFDPLAGTQSGVVQNQDAYMKGKIAQRFRYDRVKEALARVMAAYGELTGRRYGLVREHRLEDAEYALVAMGSAVETAMATVDWLREQRGVRAGVLAVTSFRPFPGPEAVRALGHVRALTVLERLDTPLGQSNPLSAEIKAAFADAASGAAEYPRLARIPEVYSGTGGLGGRDLRPRHFVAMVENMARRGERLFTVGIRHPLAIHSEERPDVRPKNAFSLRGHSIGGYGSITTNKLMAQMAADLFGLHVQAFPKYGSEKKGLPTSYYLTLAAEPVRLHAELEQVEFVVVNEPRALVTGEALRGLATGGTLVLQVQAPTPEAAWDSIPRADRCRIQARGLRVLAIDAAGIARSVATSPDLVVRMQGIVQLGVFLRAAPFAAGAGIGREELLGRVEGYLRSKFGRRGEQVIQENLTCVRRGYDEVMEIPEGLIEEGQPEAAS